MTRRVVSGIKNFSQKRADAAVGELYALVEAYVLAHGGKKNEESFGYNWTLPTKFGPYRVSVHYRKGATGLANGYLTVFGSFEDIVKQQREDFGKMPRPFPVGFPTDHHKWNFHLGTYQEITADEAFAQWERAVSRVLPAVAVNV